MLQMLHTAYNLQNEFESDKQAEMQKLVVPIKKFGWMTAPVLRRWWTVDEGYKNLKKD